jgi:exopolysaccharide production protein ExoQ
MLPTFERTYVIVALIYFTSAFTGLSGAQTATLTQSTQLDTTGLALQSVMYFGVGILIAAHGRCVLRHLHECKWPFLLAMLAVLSAAWSCDPLFSLRRGIVVLATTLWGAYFGSRFNCEEQLRLLCTALAIVAALSLITALLFPNYGIDRAVHNGDWRGIFAEKNVLGRIMVLGLIAFFTMPRSSPLAAWSRRAGLVLCGSLVVMSHSITAILVGALLLVCSALYRLLRLPAKWLVPAIAVLLGLAVLAVPVLSDLPSLSLLVGRDFTMTGRTQIWQASLLAIEQRPVLGYGFNAFWHGMDGPSASVVTRVRWLTPHAHNGYLDLMLELGALGLALFLIAIVLRLKSAIREYRIFGDRAALWPLLYLTFLLFYNMTESTGFKVNSVFWVLFTAMQIRDIVITEPQSSAMVELLPIEEEPCPA